VVPAVLDQNVMPGDETRLTVAVDEQSLMQLEAMILPDREMNLHGELPGMDFFYERKELRIDPNKSFNDLSALRTST